MIFEDMDECISVISGIGQSEIRRLGENAKELVRTHLMPAQMAEKAYSVVEQL